MIGDCPSAYSSAHFIQRWVHESASPSAYPSAPPPPLPMQVLSQDSQADLMTYRLRELYNGVPLGGGDEASDDESYEMSSMLSAHLRTPGVEFEIVWVRVAEGGSPI